MLELKKFRLQYNTVCEQLELSRDGLRQLIKRDPTFPVAMKDGNTKQSAVYFDYDELVAWHEAQKAARAKS
jgi:hypothetical protein